MTVTVVHMWTDANGTSGMSLDTHSLSKYPLTEVSTCNVTLAQTKDSRQMPGMKSNRNKAKPTNQTSKTATHQQKKIIF